MRQLLIILVSVAVLAAGATAQEHRSDRVMAVPAAKPPAIDGDLADWDLSGAVESFYDEALRSRFALSFALMYDAEALYIGARFVDDSPLVNRHDPAVEPNLGWAGDCLQVRLCSDPAAEYPLRASNSDRICHLTMWHYTDKNLPVLQIAYGMDMHGTRVLTGPASGIAFRKTDRGWTLEGRIPWALLNAAGNAPKAGDRLALVIQPLWGDASGWKHALTYNDIVREAGFSFQGTSMWGQAILSPRGNLTPAQKPAAGAEKLLPLTLELPPYDPQAVSLSSAIYDADGLLVRTLPVQTLETGGIRPAVRWDGLDDDGRPLPPGRYTVKTLTHRGIEQKYLTSLHNAGTPPWRTDDGRGAWGGDHAPPVAAASDARRVYLGWGISEAGQAVIAVEPQVRKESARKIWGQGIVLDIGINVTALATDGERVFVAQDGWHWGEDKTAPSVAGLVMWDAETGKPLNFPFGKRTIELAKWQAQGKTGLNLRGIAVTGDTIYASLYHENKVVAVNWRTGEIRDAFAVDHPAGVAIHENTLLVAAGSRVVRFDLKTNQALASLKHEFSSAIGITTDAEGNIYVSDRGDAMQVKVFNPAGDLIGTIGRKGGRPDVGRYEPDGMYQPAGLTVDSAGKVWVTEQDNSPRRVSVWSREGKLLADLLGPGAYAVEGIADEQKPEWINTHNTLFEVDYKTGAKKTLATLIRDRENQVSVGGHMGRALKFRHHNGRTYLVWPGHHIIVVYRLDDDLVGRPVAVTGWLKDVHIYGIQKQHLPEAVRDDAWRNRAAYWFRWTDLNGDSCFQPEEFVLHRPARPLWGHYWGSWVDDDLTIFSSDRNGTIYRVPVVQWLPDGVPLYISPAEEQPMFTIDDVTGTDHELPGKDCIYVLNTLRDKGGAISKYALDGRRLWSYRRVWLGFGLDSPLSQPGDLPGVMKFVGKVRLDDGHELFAVNCYFGSFGVLSEHGLWVTSLCKDNRYGPKADSSTVWPENFSGWLYRNKDNGKVYFIAGDTDTRIWEVTGTETIRVAERTFTHSDDDYRAALDALLRKQGGAAEQPPIVCGRRDVTVDGDLADWQGAAFAEINPGGAQSARAALAYDDANLYVAFDVTDPSPMKNAGTDYALLFKTGDACDVMLAADPNAAADRTRAARGDVRLLFSEMEGKPLCVLFEPVSAGRQQRRLLSSPTGVAAFDYVAVVPGARVSVKRRDGGYNLEASVPLSELGFSPRPGMVTRADVGVIFSDAGGSRNTLRAYYANKNTAIVNDIPSESRLQPQNWGILRIQ